MKPANLFRTFFFIAACFIYSNASAQTNVLGGWYITTLNYNINQKFALYSEAQVHSQRVTNDFDDRELKIGTSYYLPDKNSFFVGFGNYKTYSLPGNFKKPVAVNENRIWEQFTLNNTISRIKIEHRYRIEQRWMNGKYFNRFRYRLAAIVPVNNSAIIDKTFFINAFDEVFFTNKTLYFLRNRIFAGVGYKFNKLLTIQGGLMHQFDYRTNNNSSGKNFLITSLLFTAGNSKKNVQPKNAN